MISFTLDWLDLLAVQGTLRSLLQHHSSKASILWHSAFFMVRLSQLYMITGKIIALTIQTFVGRVMSLLFSTLSWIVIAFQPRSNCLLFLWMQSLSSVIFEPKKRKSFCGKLLKGWEYQTTLSVSLETCLRVKKQQLERCVEQQSGSGLREYDKVTTELSTFCHDPHSQRL